MASPPPISRTSLLPKLRAAFDFAQMQVRTLLESRPGHHPCHTVKGRWGLDSDNGADGDKRGCDGYLPGILWLFSRLTGDGYWYKKAEEYSLRLEERRFDRSSHDLGRLFVPAHARWYRISGERRTLDMLVQAGRTAAKRWQPKGEYLCSTWSPNSLLIDSMINVELVFLAARATGDADLADIARRHCRTVHRHLVREDGGTVQEGVFDPATGRFLRESTRLGYKPNSTWARGLAMAIYGFASAHHLSKDEEFLNTAEECAEFWLERAEPDFTAPWDLNCPGTPGGPKRQIDSTASAIACNGLWNLAGLTKDRNRRLRYAESSLRLADTLCTPGTWLAKGVTGWEGILLHGVWDMPRGVGVDESTSMGDHYLVEALYKMLSERKKGDGSGAGTSGVRKIPLPGQSPGLQSPLTGGSGSNLQAIPRSGIRPSLDSDSNAD